MPALAVGSIGAELETELSKQEVKDTERNPRQPEGGKCSQYSSFHPSGNLLCIGLHLRRGRRRESSFDHSARSPQNSKFFQTELRH
jgi:hypothetical protein